MRWMSISATVLIACGGDGETLPTGPLDGASTSVELIAALAPEVPTFKVDGELRVTFTLGGPFLGESQVGILILRAGERMAMRSMVIPRLTGFFTLREVTFTPAAPFLCGNSPSLDPRFERVVTVLLTMCQP